MKLHVVCIFSFIVGTQSDLDTNSRLKRSNPQLDTLKQKLSNLQDLLQKIGNEEGKTSTAPITTVKPEEINMAKETMMRQPQNTDNTEKNKLSSDEVAMLMAVRNTLNRKRQNKAKLRQELENKETYYDRPVVEEGTDDVTILKSLANKLAREKSIEKQKPLDDKDNLSDNSKPQPKDSISDSSQPQPKEGKFTLFRQEVFAQVEDRLLQDIDFALKMGFSVEEILTDLQAKEKRYKELQRIEMQQRIESLRKIRD